MDVLQLERTTRAPAPDPRPGPRRERERLTLAAVSLAVLAVVALGVLALVQGWGRGPVVGPGQLAVDGGVLRVDGVVSAARPRHAMPGMGTDEDPVAEGDRRISVDVTLVAGTGPLRFDAERFTLAVDGDPADHLTHRDVLPDGELPAGTRLSGTLLFDVPAAATAATLGYDGAGVTEVVLPPEGGSAAGGSAAGQDTSGAGHDDVGGHVDGTGAPLTTTGGDR